MPGINLGIFNMQAHTHVNTLPAHFQRPVPARVTVDCDKLWRFMRSNSCLCSGSLPREASCLFVLLLLSSWQPDKASTWAFCRLPVLQASCLILHQEEVTLQLTNKLIHPSSIPNPSVSSVLSLLAEGGPYSSPVQTPFYCPWLISFIGKSQKD